MKELEKLIQTNFDEVVFFQGEDMHAYYFRNKKYEIKIRKDDQSVYAKEVEGEDWYYWDTLR